jgi:hypothetical protein
MAPTYQVITDGDVNRAPTCCTEENQDTVSPALAKGIGDAPEFTAIL